jgi:uncharacterized integral membrane protein
VATEEPVSTEQPSLQAEPPGEVSARRRHTPAERRERVRLLAGLIIGALVTAFALLNLNDVKVHWIVATGRTPLIVVIVVAFVLGVIVDRFVLRRRRKRRARP